MIKPRSTSVLQAAICLCALDVLKRLDLARDVSKQQVVQKLGVARSYVYDLYPKIEAAVARGLDDKRDEESIDGPELRRLEVRNAVLEYRLEHPGCWVAGGRTVYSPELVAFVLELASKSIGPRMSQADFAAACGIPLPTLKDWLADKARQLALPFVPAAPAAPPAPPEPTTSPATSPQPADGEQPDLGLSLEMKRIIAAYENWQGTLPAFVLYLRGLGLHYGRERVSQILHLAAKRKLLRRPPPPPPARGSTLRPPPGIQWTSDGMQLKVVVDNQIYDVNWQPTVDVGSSATVGSVVRPEEDTAGVLAAVADGVQTTGAPPAALLLDNKACNKSPVLADALAPETFVMHTTLGRGQNKAIIEGGFGLFAQGLGPLIATVDTSSPECIALCVADAVTRAYEQGRNHHPRRDGRTPYELYRDADHSPEEIAAAIERLRAIKERIDSREARELARLDPAVAATIEYACQRFAFVDDGDVAASLRSLPLPAIQSAVAIYAAKQRAGSLPLDAGIRYFAGIARNCQHERELLCFEQELVDQLERTGKLVRDRLERKAADFAALDLAPRLRAIVDELLTVAAPIAQIFWRRRFQTEAAFASLALRPDLRRFLCERIRRRFTTTKQHRQQFVDFVVRTLTGPSPNEIADQPQPHPSLS